MVARLLWRKLAHGRKHTKRVACKHNDVARLPIDRAWYMRIRNELDRVRAARVLRDAHVVIVRRPTVGIVDDVLKDASKADGIVNLGLLRGGEVDGLGIASALDIEYAGVRPDMLVVADEHTPWVGTEGCLSRSRQAKKESDVTLVNAYICGRMERQLTKLDRL